MYWTGGPQGVAAFAAALNTMQQEYWDVVHACPPPPDIVFEYKVFSSRTRRSTKRKRVEYHIEDPVVDASCSNLAYVDLCNVQCVRI